MSDPQSRHRDQILHAEDNPKARPHVHWCRFQRHDPRKDLTDDKVDYHGHTGVKTLTEQGGMRTRGHELHYASWRSCNHLGC